MTEQEQIKQILTEEVKSLIERLEQGREVLVRGGYIFHSYKERIIDRNCGNIVAKLVSLGYTYTSNHGHGCRDYHFTKNIEIDLN